MKRVITFGTFDMFHYGHIKILERASKLGDELIVGVSSDNLNYSKKERYPLYSEEERMHIISCLGFVNHSFIEHSLDLKREYLIEHRADILVMGHDWEGKFDEFKDICKVVYLPRTPDISTTELMQRVKSEF